MHWLNADKVLQSQKEKEEVLTAPRDEPAARKLPLILARMAHQSDVKPSNVLDRSANPLVRNVLRLTCCSNNT